MQSSVLCDDDEINRTILWKRGRLNKEGEFVGDELKQTVNKIIKKNADVLVVYGLSSANTSLTLAKAMLLQDQTTVVAIVTIDTNWMNALKALLYFILHD
ncbi:uncharacterized protein LOC121980523 isoform X3 [Zingiber officinale]|uniref:uncharacterized protein LOC121980523 isoform X3 n=1 Tax=Zingiber officinale TaxID=94328 RepID=UPI001C4C6596|nr:uncharacterized protein LOC121980523 isoform X3 [Zingiber officinale]